MRLLAKPLPLFFDHAEGALIYDVDGNAYIDHALGQGSLIVGHSHPAILDAVKTVMLRGQLYAGQSELEITVAEALVRLTPSAELCRFGLSGSEMVQAAMRLARAVTVRTDFGATQAGHPARSPPLEMKFAQRLAAPEAVFEAIPELEFDQTANPTAEAGLDRLGHNAGVDAEPIPELEFYQ